ncbi:MAG: glycosyltransferase [Geminocystis sp.]|nr:glycosyltransferase [Geminocystis sp.]MCS7147143.1 glycosyltransferase [Geminocystis sp.]
MKILFITFYFPPYNTIASVRTGKTARILTELGFEVFVVAGKEEVLLTDLPVEIPKKNISYTEYFDFEERILKLLGKDKKSMKEILHSGVEKSFAEKVVKKLFAAYKYIAYTPDKHIGWYYPAKKKAEEIIANWRPDLIYASAMPYTSLMIGASLSKKYNIPFIAELRDLWFDNHYVRHNFISRILENKTLNQSSAIITVSEPLVEKLKRRYNKPVFEIRNGFDEEDFTFDITLGILERERQKENEKVIITYTGSLYSGKQDPSKLFEAIAGQEYLKSKVMCKFYGDNLWWVKELAEKYSVQNNVEVHERIGRQESLKIQARSDILLLVTWNDPKERGVYTGKLFEYIGNAKPILAIGNTDNVAAKLINDYGFGVATNETKDIKQFIANCEKRSFLETIASNYEKHRHLFSRRTQVKKLADIFALINNSQ